ncbi:MAG: DNA polymerase III subunit gamma/tau [Patescibacteria group bacterium]|nr:DNA polymerase III subunit gamma/tau [Patescibacteria group bacterium]MDE2437777.1 DNA polymerase III subunit gamma/tau [Patescibacteria group bacterium]
MSHVFYRTYRPKTFREIQGQHFAVRVLTEAINRNTISHAYLFAGPRGTGKTTLARILAKALNCAHLKKGDPCGTCEICLAIERGTFVDVIEMDAASHRGIDDIRAIKEAVEFQPMQSAHKVYIIDEAHMLTKDACNALLKVLEEPPEYVVFILATTEPEKMIPTVLSRVQRFDFTRLSFSEVHDKLNYIVQQEGLKIPTEVIDHICYVAEGGLRDAETMLNQIAHTDFATYDIHTIFNRPHTARIIAFLRAIAAHNQSAALSFLTECERASTEPLRVLKDTLSLARKTLLLKLNEPSRATLVSEMSEDDVALLSSCAAEFSTPHLTTLIRNLMDARKYLYYSPIPFLPLELAVIQSTEHTS